MSDKTTKKEQSCTIDSVSCCYKCDDNRVFNYLNKITPPKSTRIFIHTKDNECLEAYATKTDFGWDFLLTENQIWIDENDIIGWSFPQ